jgi:MtaA/CmuA family methyltransferase
MTGKERVLARFAHRPVDCLPFMPITMMFAADHAGIPYRQYATNGDALAEAQLRVAESYGFDYVSAISDPAREAADLGAKVEFFEDQPPAIVESEALLHDKSVLAKLKPPNLSGPGRMGDRLKALRRLSAAVGDSLIVEGWVEGPVALAADLRGLNALMLDFYDDPPFVEDLMDFCVNLEIEFARAQVQAGATLVGIGDAAASLVGPKLYRQFGATRERRLVRGIQEHSVPVRLHICGNTRKILPEMGATGADMIDLDYLTPVREGRAALGGAQVLLGNIDPVRVLRDGTPDSIADALAVCHAEAGENYIVGAGCEIPRGTPSENVLAMARFARSRS